MKDPARCEPLLRVRNLRVAFRLDKHTTFEAVKGISFDIPQQPHRRAGRRIGQRQVGDLARDPRAPAARELDRRSAAARSSTAAATWSELDQARAARAARRRHLDDLPGADDLAQPGVHRRLPARPRCCGCTWACAGAQARKRAIELLDEVGIPDPEYKINAYPSQMSGGQQQRVMIAMAIACEPKLLIADEPTTALDVTIQKQILDLIAALQKKHQMSVLFITHDLAVVGEIADHVVVMRNGEIREQGPAKARVRESAGRLHEGAAAMPAAARPAPGAAAGDRRLHGRRARTARATCRERVRGVDAGRSDRPRREEPRQELLLARGPVRQARVRGGEGRVVQAAQGQDARARRRIGLGQDDGRASR